MFGDRPELRFHHGACSITKTARNLTTDGTSCVEPVTLRGIWTVGQVSLNTPNATGVSL
jgi:hypothetical protein